MLVGMVAITCWVRGSIRVRLAPMKFDTQTGQWNHLGQTNAGLAFDFDCSPANVAAKFASRRRIVMRSPQCMSFSVFKSKITLPAIRDKLRRVKRNCPSYPASFIIDSLVAAFPHVSHRSPA